MAGLLTETIRHWASSPAPEFPCGLAVLEYASAIAGHYPDELPWHQSKEAVLGLLHAKRGLINFAASLVEPLGWHRLELSTPLQRGDIGVAYFPAMGATCAIFLGRKWAARGSHQVLLASALPNAVWRFDRCQVPLPDLSLEP